MYESMVGSELKIMNQGLRKTNEFEILLDLTENQIASISSPEIALAIMRVREGKVKLQGGYDGLFGKINIFSAKEREKMSLKPKQLKLFEL
jgi:PHP family Zn ribbon phosphoesterase